MTPKFASVLLLVVFCALSGTALIGCTRGLALHRGVLDYDRAVSRAQAEMLLLNVARARYDRPLHFTTVTGIAATFEYRLDAALGAELVENPDLSLLLPSVATGISESPTASIVPIHGEDFAKRLLTPFEETKFAYFIEQGEDPDIILRLMASEILIGVGAQQMRYRNDPGRPEEYRSFRQYALHLAMLGQTNQLHVGPITYQQTWPIPPETDMALAEYVDVLEQGYELKSVPGKGLALTTEVAGRIAITNYALTALPNEERQRLQELAERRPLNFVFVDIRSGYPGGEFPFRGWFRLRSFNALIDFIAADIAEEPEFPVMPDPRTGAVEDNPVSVLKIMVTDRPRTRAAFVVEYEGGYYSITDAPHGELHRHAFEVLYQLFQLTVTEVRAALVPPVTISK